MAGCTVGADRNVGRWHPTKGRRIVSTNFGAGDPGIPGRNAQSPHGEPAPQPGSPQSQIPREDEEIIDPFAGTGATDAAADGEDHGQSAAENVREQGTQ